MLEMNHAGYADLVDGAQLRSFWLFIFMVVSYIMLIGPLRAIEEVFYS